MLCPNCGENNPAGDKFCGSCGKPLPAVSTDFSPTPLPLPPTPQTAPLESVAPLQGRPVARRGPHRISVERSNRLLLLYGLLIAFIAVVLVVYFTTSGASSNQSFVLTITDDTGTPTATTPVPSPVLGIGTAVPDEGNAHAPLQATLVYTTYPPSSGIHYPDTAPNGFSEVEIPEGYFVHSMEHGAIVLYYRPDVSEDIKQQLKDLFNKLPQDKYGMVKLVVVPYTKGMTTPLAIAAWDRLLLMKEYNFDEIQAFYMAWVDKGPENVP